MLLIRKIKFHQNTQKFIITYRVSVKNGAKFYSGLNDFLDSDLTTTDNPVKITKFWRPTKSDDFEVTDTEKQLQTKKSV